jgi:hypothetical protein
MTAREIAMDGTAIDDRTRHQSLGRMEFLAILAFWTFIAVITAANRLADPRGPGPGPAGASDSVTIALAFAQSYLWAALTPLIFLLVSYFGLDRSHRLGRIVLYIAVGLTAALLVDQLMIHLQREVFDLGPGARGDGGGRGPGGGRGMGPGGFGGPGGGRGGRGGPGGFGGPDGPGNGSILSAFRRPMIMNHFVFYFGVVAAGFARDYFLRYRARLEEGVRLQAQAAHLQAQLADARLAALRSQLDPHFLFNTLHAVSSLVERDPRGVRRMIARLSELLRYSLEEATEREVPLEQELVFLDRYLEIMRIRFQGRLEVATEIEPGVSLALVPNLILQPLVENAVKHGVNKVDDGGRIEIRARRDGERVVMTVRDNGPGLVGGGVPAEEGVGLRNTRERLSQLYGSAQSLVLRDAEGGGLIAEIIVPFHTANDLRATGVSPDS